MLAPRQCRIDDLPQPLPPHALLAFDDLACHRGERVLFAGLCGALASGDLLKLTGPNGSGKTSLLRQLAGFLPKAAGRIEFFAEGRAVAREEGPALAYLGHLDGLKAALTLRENLTFWARFRDRSSLPAAHAVTSALEALELAPVGDLPLRFLSAGQRRRAALARLALEGAQIWLLDEPTSHLDRRSTANFLALLADHRRKGGAAMLATHEDLDWAESAHLDLGALPGAGREASR